MLVISLLYSKKYLDNSISLIVLNLPMKETLPFIEYNTSNKDYARYNRKNPTPAELKLWKEVLNKDQLGYRFLRQKLLSGFIADFYCSKLLLVIEVDGEIHNKQKEYDEKRSKVLNGLGIFVMRFSNEQVLNNID